MTKDFTPEHHAWLVEYLNTHAIPSGIGTKESACSIAAINLAMTGELTDRIPNCMSLVLGKAIIRLQDAMPHDMRNSDRYKRWLPSAAGTGRDHEKERLDILLAWMWDVVLPELQSVADENGFGEKWRQMCKDKTRESADAAAYAAYAAADAAARAAYAADAAAYVAYAAARAAADAADAAARDARDGFWDRVDPIGVLERMTMLGGSK